MFGFICILIATVRYAGGSINCFLQKDYVHAGMWASYTSANTCLLFYEYSKL